MMDMFLLIVIGAVAGWLIGMMRHLDVIPSLVFGIVGGFIGHFVFGLLKISFGEGFPGMLLPVTLGAVLVVFLFSVIKKKA